MNAAGEGPQQLDAVSVLNAKTTLVQLLERAGVRPADAEELIGLVEAGAVAVAHRELGAGNTAAPEGKGELYAAGWLDGARAVTDGLAEIAERTLHRVVAGAPAGAGTDERRYVSRMEVERAKVAVTPLYLAFTTESDLDPEVSEQVLTAVLGTLGARQRAGYAGQLARFASDHRAHLERLYAGYGPGSATAIHGRYSLLHSPTSVAVLERLAVAPTALREKWDAAELPPAWLDGLTTAWGAPA
ncbi:hypothetical protein [Streptomyces sp. NRRL S-87]|uniref:hypothetical protein n=1 Tax=Streptomyces sp. NRRL S-87 TaxID=1463920 RepID=UPI0004C1FFA5|nr:hypothetical protein [Streptomyces sp. NRRL S-87]